MYLVIPSILYLHSCTNNLGLEALTQSISPFKTSFLEIGRFLTHTNILACSEQVC